MYLQSKISETFTSQFNLESCFEKFDECEFQYVGRNIVLPDEENINGFLLHNKWTDDVDVIITLGELDPVIYQNTTNNEKQFYANLKSKIPYYEHDAEIKIKLKISKKSENPAINIYSIKAFSDFLEGLSVKDFLQILSSRLVLYDKIIFKSAEISNSFNTNSIYFKKQDDDPDSSLFEESRKERIGKISSSCSFNNTQTIKLQPEDLFFMQEHTHSKIDNAFKKALSALIITCLFDITSLEKDNLTYRLNGYKSINGDVEIAAPLKSLRIYYEIYKWVYSSGSLTDKMGLARNIISLHFINNRSIEIEENTLTSLHSAHKVYEKQNIKQYIELRNKISDQIWSFNEKANKIIETFASGFQKSAIAFVSLFSTMVITKVLTTKSFSDIFTFDATIISLLFLFGSLIYFFISLWEVNAQLKRFKESYSNMKKRNSDLLTEDDINKILSSDKEHLSDLEFINGKRKYYSLLWISFLFLFLSATLFLHLIYSKKLPTENTLFKGLYKVEKDASSKEKKIDF